MLASEPLPKTSRILQQNNKKQQAFSCKKQGDW